MTPEEVEQFAKKLDRETCKLKFMVIRIAQKLGLSAEELGEIDAKATVDTERASLLYREKIADKTND